MANKRMNFSLPSDVADHLTRAQRQSRYLARLVREATGRVRAGLALLESAGWSPGQRAAAIDAVIASGGEDVDVVSALGHQPLLVELSLPERVRGRPELAEALLVLAREWSLGDRTMIDPSAPLPRKGNGDGDDDEEPEPTPRPKRKGRTR